MYKLFCGLTDAQYCTHVNNGHTVLWLDRSLCVPEIKNTPGAPGSGARPRFSKGPAPEVQEGGHLEIWSGAGPKPSGCAAPI